MKKIKVTLIRSTINRIESHKRVVKSLGLNKLNSSRIHDDNPVIRGMINKVSYMLKVEEVQGE
ncbi:MAG: 50S ribosomal protein L30 [Candidatus Cloacimonetes bacterium]|jgi:large subunit ribosomal protein L30|nr:50S ribosomal protein L30 [Candidatus Cloacimonadota bacterium]MDY0298553.1 50S ribosomal protein L30 [Candidatus Cloacimonadaceae bacterium]MCB5278710.1 50S ribosomal protein L30 [Candidatus Cloacimonadota bacterium]MCK9331878.1 50S ribosomal protein L30 [Candidatus Cloacimonadota bacterium]MDD2209754.1 50S ribosomal protein L30 [Candidatus Cloacimonadota bacterium]